MTAPARRAFSVLFLAILLSAAGATVLAAGTAWGAARPAQSGSAPPPGKPGATTGVLGEHFVRFCVHGFKPNSTVTVTNKATGKTLTFRVGPNGKGCIYDPIMRSCKAVTQTIIATGTGADGKPALVSQTVTAPPTPSLCAGTTSSGALPFTGSDIIIPGIIIGVVLIGVGTAMTIVRRRRDEGSAA